MTRTERLLGLALLAGIAGAGCGKNPRYCDDQTACGYQGWVCDIDGVCPASDDLRNSCIPPDEVCWDAGGGDGDGDGGSPDASTTCTPDSAGCLTTGDMSEWVVCDSEGTVASRRPCPLGCDDVAGCSDLDPSNGLAAYLDETQAEDDIVLSGSATIDTTTGTVTDGGGAVVVTTYVFDDMRVLVVRSLRTGDVTVTGAHPLAIVSNGDIIIGGDFSVSAAGVVPGPGGRSGLAIACVGRNGSDQAASVRTGGGGGSLGTLGGRGAFNTTEPTFGGGAAGQEIAAGDKDLAPLLAGCAGGNFDVDEDSTLDGGGAGGGAVQLVSRTAIRLQGGTLSANGGGGGPDAATGQPAGGGGGSGGGILLEAPAITSTGTSGVFANGGGGSCKAVATGATVAGADGLLSTLPASGGSCPAGSSGGAGAAASAPTGATGQDSSDGSVTSLGGGGGGMGVVRVNAPGASFTLPSGLVASPAPGVGLLRSRTVAP